MGSRSKRAALVAALTAVALAGVASPAAGQSVELTDEATAEHCPAVSLSGGTVSGGCPVHLVDDQLVAFSFHWAGIETGEACHLEITARFDEQGQGYVDQIDFSSAGFGACEPPMCPMYNPLPWPATLSEAGGSVGFEFELCFDEDLGGALIMCPFRATVAEPATHGYQATVTPTTCSAVNGGVSMPYPLEVDGGRLESEAASETVEIVHP